MERALSRSAPFLGGLLFLAKHCLSFRQSWTCLSTRSSAGRGCGPPALPSSGFALGLDPQRGSLSLLAAKAASCSENQRHLRWPRSAALALPRPPCLIPLRLALWGGFSGRNRPGVRAQLCPTLRPRGLRCPAASSARGVFPESTLERAVISSCEGSS